MYSIMEPYVIPLLSKKAIDIILYLFFRCKVSLSVFDSEGLIDNHGLKAPFVRIAPGSVSPRVKKT